MCTWFKIQSTYIGVCICTYVSILVFLFIQREADIHVVLHTCFSLKCFLESVYINERASCFFVKAALY